MVKRNEISVFNFNNWRSFLKAEWANMQLDGFTFRDMSKAMETSSPSYFQLILNGQRTPSPQKLDKISHYMQLNTLERHYLFCLYFQDTINLDFSKEVFTDKADELRKIANG